MEGVIKGFDYETSRRLRDVSKAHRKHWESIKYQCYICKMSVEHDIEHVRFSRSGQLVHLKCSSKIRHEGYLLCDTNAPVQYFKSIVLSGHWFTSITRRNDGVWRHSRVDLKDFGLTKEAEELYQKYLKWKEY